MPDCGLGPFRLDLRELAEAAILIDSRGLILGLSPAFEAVSGWLEDDLKGRSLYRIVADDGDLQADHRCTVVPVKALAGVRRYRCRDGGLIQGEAMVLPLHCDDRAALGNIVIVQRISRQVRPTDRLLPLLQATEAKIGEGGDGGDLERFARIASHDMQEPLRRIIAYCDLLKQDHGGELSTEAVEIADIIQSGGRRLRLIVNDLLIYVRVRGQLDRAFEPVDMSAVLCHAMEEMHDIFEAQNVRMNAVHLPLVWGRAPLFRMVFRHLLSNALKHCGERSPVIDIGVDDLGDAWQFAVADHGMGVEARHADRIFRIFQGLDGKDEREGSGAGLAVCKLIIERCGGEIWLDRAYNRGARFLFTLPKAKPDGRAETSVQEATPSCDLGLLQC